MLAVLAFDRKEIDLCRKLCRWIVDLGGVKEHEILLVPSRRTHEEGLHKEIGEILQSAFKKVHWHFPTTEREEPWPNAANHAWVQAVQAVEWNHGDQPFFWFEVDSCPLCPEWLDRISMAFRVAAKPFMGARVIHADVPEHLTGISVYWHTMRWCPDYAVLRFQQGYQGQQVAWDVALAPRILSNAFITDLIQHEWRPDSFPDFKSLDRINPSAVIYHQCKDGSLIDLLQQHKYVIEESTKMLQVSLGETLHCPEETLPPQFTNNPAYQAASHEVDQRGVLLRRANTIYTYFEPVDDIDESEQFSLIDLWKFSWRKAGWNPVVIRPTGFVFDRPELDNLCTCLGELPSVNPRGYDQACFYRWVQMSIHGGWMCDYDVMNNGFEPEPTPERLTVYQTHNACPSLVAGPGSEFLRMAQLFAKRGSEFIETVHGSPHVSDMHLIQAMPEEYDQKSLVVAYGNPGWQTAKAIHFANQTMNGKKPRSTWIPKLLFAGGDTNSNGGSIADSVRHHVKALAEIVGDTPSRKIVVQRELRTARLIGHPPSRKKKRSMSLA